jgi:hypothetical protein
MSKVMEEELTVLLGSRNTQYILTPTYGSRYLGTDSYHNILSASVLPHS